MTAYLKRTIFVACRSDEMMLKSAVELVGGRQLRVEHGLPTPGWRLALGAEKDGRAADPGSEQT